MQVELPAFAGGDYLLDAIARDGHGNSLGWGCWVVSAAAQGSLNVRLDQEVYQPGSQRRSPQKVGQAREGDYTATLQVWDAL